MDTLPDERLLLPLEPGPFRMALGLVSRPADELVEIDALYPAEMQGRRRLLDTRRDEVFAALPTSQTARGDVLAVLAELLPCRYPSWFARQGPMLHNRLTGESFDVSDTRHDPLETAGRLVQEDLCIIGTGGPAPVLEAAVLCAPSRWRLADKIGRPLLGVHGPVPLYAERLSAAVDRFMRALRPGKLAERFNWGLFDDAALFQPQPAHGVAAEITETNALDRLFLRVERQTLMRLPASGAVLFAIRVHSYALRRVLGAPGAAAALAGMVRAMPDEMAAYKGILGVRGAVLAALDNGRWLPGMPEGGDHDGCRAQRQVDGDQLADAAQQLRPGTDGAAQAAERAEIGPQEHRGHRQAQRLHGVHVPG